MINKEFKEVIKIVSKKMEQNGIKWALIGSTNMALQGMDVNPRDIDLVVKLSDLKKMKSIFSNYRLSEIKELKPFTGESVWDIKIRINNIEIEILGEKDNGEYVRKLLANRIVKIRLDEIEIPCFALEAESQTYAETNKKHKADMINNFLEKSP